MPNLKQLAQEIFHNTLHGVDVRRAFSQKFKRHGSTITAGDFQLDLAAFRTIHAVAIGKASVAMAHGLASQLRPEFPLEGVLVAPQESIGDVPGFRAIAASHPFPNEASFLAGRTILDLLEKLDRPDALLFFLLSGGSSSLVELPIAAEITLRDVRELYRLLVHCGAPIDQINAVRKHLSSVKGGRLAAVAPAAMKVSLAVMDVPEGKESALGSGPTLPDPTTVQDARRVIERYGLLRELPGSIRAKFEQTGRIPETPKPGDPIFARTRFCVLLGMQDLFESARRAAEARGFTTACDNATDNWPVKKAAVYLLAKVRQLRAARPGARIAVIADGEVSSPVTGKGTGGRNSAFVLECVPQISGENLAVLSAGTDGKDGSSPAAGAVADGRTLERARALGLDPEDFARRSDSYNFFRRLGDAVETGPTHNNLRDLRILLAE